MGDRELIVKGLTILGGFSGKARTARPTGSPHILLIGGVSSAGKTEAAARLGKHHNLDVLHLDDVCRSLPMAYHSISFRQGIMRSIGPALIDAHIEAGFRGIIEGVWFDVPYAAQVAAANPTVFSAFLGIENIDPARHLAAIRAEGKHWLATHDDAAALKMLREEMAKSRDTRRQCQRQDVPYFDFSDPDAGTANLTKHLRRADFV